MRLRHEYSVVYHDGVLFHPTDGHYFFDLFSMHFFASPADPLPTVTRHDLDPAYVSRLMHEVTHLDCMRTDLGIGLILNLLRLRHTFKTVAKDRPLEASDGPITDPRTGKPMLLRPLLAEGVLAWFAEAAVALEGLAMYAQLDLRFGSEEASCVQFRSIVQLLVRAGSPLPRVTGDMLNAISTYHEDVRQFTRRDEDLLRTLLFGTTRRNSYYLFGYAFIKSLAHILAQKDSRYRAPEMAYLFLRGFLFNGEEFICGGDPKAWHVGETLLRRLDLLREAPAHALKACYDALANDTEDRLADLDLAHFLRSGNARAAAPQRLQPIIDSGEVEVDELARWSMAKELIPLKMVSMWIAAAQPRSDDAALKLVSRSEDRYACVVKLVSRDRYEALQREADERGKVIPERNPLDPAAVEADAIGDPARLCFLWTTAFSASKFSQVDLWSSPGEVFRDDDGTLTALSDEMSVLNFYYRRSFADFFTEELGAGARLPWWGGLVHEFCLGVYQSLMTPKDGPTLNRLLNHGFALLSEAARPLADDGNLSRATSKQLNTFFTYPIFE